MEIKLKLKVRDVEIELSKDEAIKLRELLDELTGNKTITVEKYVPYRDYLPYQPYQPYWPYPTWVCETNSVPSCTYTIGNDVSLSVV